MPWSARRTVGKTRKAHQCEGCLTPVPAGATMTQAVGRFEGNFYSVYLCAPCAAILRDPRFSELWVEGWASGEIGELRAELEEAEKHGLD